MKDEINDAPMAQDEPSVQELTRGMALISRAMQRRQAKANEVTLKGLYVDFLFDALQLTRYR